MTDEQLRKQRGVYRQRLLFNMDHYSPYYGYGKYHEGQHKWSYAMDEIGKDGGKDNCYAPCDCIITNVFKKSGCSPEVWLQSEKPVLTRTGDIDYYTTTITHPAEILKMKVGTKYKQMGKVCVEGDIGVSSGNHEHLEVGKGKSKTWAIEVHNGITYYMNQNKVKPNEVMFLPETSVIDFITDIVGSKYPIKKESEMTRFVSSKNGLYLHSSKSYSKSTEIALLDYEEPCIVFEESGSFAKVYARGLIGYVAKSYLKTITPINAKINSSDGLVLHTDPNFDTTSEMYLMKDKEQVKWYCTLNKKYAYVVYKNWFGYCSKNYLKRL